MKSRYFGTNALSAVDLQRRFSPHRWYPVTEAAPAYPAALAGSVDTVRYATPADSMTPANRPQCIHPDIASDDVTVFCRVLPRWLRGLDLECSQVATAVQARTDRAEG